MEEVKSNAGHNLGVAALIVGILTFVLAVIPCVGILAIIPGIVAIVLASVGLSQASRSDAPKGMQVAGLVIGIIALMIAFSQVFVAGRLANDTGKWPMEIKNVIDDVKDEVMKDLQDGTVNIKIESDGDVVEINARTRRKDLEKTLEELEGVDSERGDTLEQEKTDSLEKTN